MKKKKSLTLREEEKKISIFISVLLIMEKHEK